MATDTFFPSGCFSESAEVDAFWANLYGQYLTALGERPLHQQPALRKKTYRFFSVEPHGLMVRMEHSAGSAKAVSKKTVVCGTSCSLSEISAIEAEMSVPNRGVRTLEKLMAKCAFWDMPSSMLTYGLDGWHGVLEVLSFGRYHVVDRWCPEGTYGKVCNYFVKLGRLAHRPRRGWWRHALISTAPGDGGEFFGPWI